MAENNRKRERREKRVRKELDKLLRRHEDDGALNIPASETELKLIVFSDQHKGGRDKADDFEKAERAYNAALRWYLNAGYTLIELGDVEELWEEKPRIAIANYPRTLYLTSLFHEANRYFRVFGNHDDHWNKHHAVRRLLWPVVGEGLKVHESLRFDIESDRWEGAFRLLLVHGHQGSLMSDVLAPIAKLFVRLVWRPIQRRTGFSWNTPAKSWKLRSAHNKALHKWSSDQENLLLVAGHTHKPVFFGGDLKQQLAAEIQKLRQDGTDQEQLNDLEVALEWEIGGDPVTASADLESLTKILKDASEQLTWTYFNTGCCCYLDGDITGLEFSDGVIRLVRWPDDEDRPRRKILVEVDMADVVNRP